MPRAQHTSHQVGNQRPQKGNASGVAAQNALCDLQHEFQAAGRLQNRGARHNRQNNQHDIYGHRARRHTENENLYQQANVPADEEGERLHWSVSADTKKWVIDIDIAETAVTTKFTTTSFTPANSDYPHARVAGHRNGRTHPAGA